MLTTTARPASPFGAARCSRRGCRLRTLLALAAIWTALLATAVVLPAEERSGTTNSATATGATIVLVGRHETTDPAALAEATDMVDVADTSATADATVDLSSEDGKDYDPALRDTEAALYAAGG